MISVDDCLATFATAALLGAPDARDQARRAVDAYLEPCPDIPLDVAEKLRRLLAAFDGMKIESRAAVEIRADIEARLVGLEIAPVVDADCQVSVASAQVCRAGS